MARKIWVAALACAAAMSAAAAVASGPTSRPAPSDSADTRYCLRIEAVTGTRLERIKCWTRAEWAEQGVDVDKDWAKEGVAIIGPGNRSL